jgi:hypothetical protein
METLAGLGVVTGCSAFLAAGVAGFRVGLSSPAGPIRTLSACGPVALVSAGTVALLYTFLFHQSRVGYAAFQKTSAESKKTGSKMPSFTEIKYGHLHPSVVAADRTVGNLLEQLAPFL